MNRKIGWSTNIFNKQLRNKLRVYGKVVAATDYDLIIYTPKGMAFILEQKALKAALLKNKYVDVPKLQIDIILQTAEQLKPKPNALLILYDAEEVEQQELNSIIYVSGLKKHKKSFQIYGKYPARYRVPERVFTKMTIQGFIDFITKTVAKPYWQRMALHKHKFDFRRDETTDHS